MLSQIFGNDHNGTSFEAVLQFPCQKAWKSPSTTLFALDCCFWGHKGVPPHQRHPQIPWITGTGIPNLDPFFTSSFDHITFDQMTMKHSLYICENYTSTIQKGPMWFYFALEEKLCGPDGVSFFKLTREVIWLVDIFLLQLVLVVALVVMEQQHDDQDMCLYHYLKKLLLPTSCC